MSSQVLSFGILLCKLRSLQEQKEQREEPPLAPPPATTQKNEGTKASEGEIHAIVLERATSITQGNNSAVHQIIQTLI